MPTLEQLENDFWDDPDFDSSLVQRCHRLRKVPIDEFTASDLRLMILQKIGLPYLVPKALEILGNDPLFDASYYPGDLLAAVLHAYPDFCGKSPEITSSLTQIAKRTLKSDTDISQLERDLEKFIGQTGSQ